MAYLNNWRNFCVCVVIAILYALAFKNVIIYSDKFSLKQAAAESSYNLIKSINISAGVDNYTDSAAVLSFYSLLNSLGNDKTLHSVVRFGIIVFDIDFYRGRYVKKSVDTILQPCAIQPFSVPALTRLPLLSPFASDLRNCIYESYGYQYLPIRYPMASSSNAAACELAKARGFSHVVVIRKNANLFEARPLNCSGQ